MTAVRNVTNLTTFHRDSRLRTKIKNLEKLQTQRIDAVERQKNELDAVLDRKQREIDNLRAQLGEDQ